MTTVANSSQFCSVYPISERASSKMKAPQFFALAARTRARAVS